MVSQLQLCCSSFPCFTVKMSYKRSFGTFQTLLLVKVHNYKCVLFFSGHTQNWVMPSSWRVFLWLLSLLYGEIATPLAASSISHRVRRGVFSCELINATLNYYMICLILLPSYSSAHCYCLWLLIRSSNNLILNLPFLHGSHKSMSLGPTPLSWLLAIYLIFCYQSDLLKNSQCRDQRITFSLLLYTPFPIILHSLQAAVLITTKGLDLFLS